MAQITEKIHIIKVWVVMWPPYHYKWRQTAYRPLLPFVPVISMHIHRQTDGERDVSSLQSKYVAFFGSLFPYCWQFVGGSASAGNLINFPPKKSDPDATGGGFPLGPSYSVICLKFFWWFFWWPQVDSCIFEWLRIGKMLNFNGTTLYLHVANNCPEMYKNIK